MGRTAGTTLRRGSHIKLTTLHDVSGWFNFSLLEVNGKPLHCLHGPQFEAPDLLYCLRGIGENFFE